MFSRNMINKHSFIIPTIAIAFLLCVGLIVYYVFFYMSDKEKILERIDAFEIAYNSGDVDAALDCLDGKSKNALRGFSGLGSQVLGFDLNSLFGIAVATQDINISIKVKSITFIDSNLATVNAELQYSGDYLNSESITVETLKMKKEKNEWYIVEELSF